MRNAECGVTKQSAPKASPMPIVIHGEASQHGYRDGVRHIPPEPAGSAIHRDYAGRQRIIANDTFFFASDISARRAAHLIGARPALQPIVKRSLPAAEFRDFVVIREGLRPQ